MTLGEWCREVLLARANSARAVAATAAEHALLAEVVALRTILLNVLYKLAPQEQVTDEVMERLIERADKERFQRAKERLASAAKRGQ